MSVAPPGWAKESPSNGRRGGRQVGGFLETIEEVP